MMTRNRILTLLAFTVLLATWQAPNIGAAVSRLKTWTAAETLTASDLNAEFNNVLNNGEDLSWPATKAKDLDGQSIQLDGDQDTHITSDTDDRVDFSLGGFDGVRFDGTTASSVNGFDLATQSTGVAPEIKSRGESNIGWEFQDSNGNEIIIGAALASAVNEITIENAATGNAPTIRSTGEADIGLEFQNSDSEELLILTSVSTALNEISITNAATGVGPTISVTGETNVDLNLSPAGTGQVDIGTGGATQAEQETGTAADRIVTPAVQQFHPSAAKAWVKFDVAGTINASQNVSSVTDTGTGDWTVNLTTAFSSVDYAVVLGWRDDADSSDTDRITVIGAQAVGSFQIRMRNTNSSTPSLSDPGAADDMHAVAFGDQ